MGTVPVWWKTVIWCGRTPVQRTRARNAIFPGTAVLLIARSTPLQHLSNVLSLQQERAPQSQGEFLSPVSIYLAETEEKSGYPTDNNVTPLACCSSPLHQTKPGCVPWSYSDFHSAWAVPHCLSPSHQLSTLWIIMDSRFTSKSSKSQVCFF